MGLNKNQKLNIVAPLLRGLCGKGKNLPRVRFTKGADHSKATVRISLQKSHTPGEILEKLRSAIGSKTDKIAGVEVEDLGGFVIERTAEQAKGRVAGKVAVVTGAAQGFGLEISQSLAKQGAFVVLGDINEEGAKTAAEDICSDYGTRHGTGLYMDVTDQESVREVVNTVIENYGGLDLLVSNAGVLKADSVKTLPVKDFEFVTSVNYKGYFICVQAVASVFALQHQANRDYISDIIQINSKSGLKGSNRNAAYAGGKFGGIGLTQSFALELIEDRIKVNSICPGNFFDGPLWSDPENGLFIQYFRTNKVPGAKTVEDVKKAYEAKVPFRRGCRTEDVMKAIYYLIEQDYETGQALPVTGGQVMLR